MHYPSSMSSVSGIQGQPLEVTVVSCNRLKDTEWISRQDPYVCLEYASSKFRTRTCTDGNKNPSFQEKFTFSLIEGLREITVNVWNSNTLSHDDFIGTGKIQLHKVLSQGFDDSTWTLQSKTGRYAGEVRLIMHYSNANKHGSSHAPSVPPYGAAAASQYALPPSTAPYSYPPAAAYPSSYQYPSAYPPNPSAYPPNPVAYPPNPAAYPPNPAPYPPNPAAYPPNPTAYPPSPYNAPPQPAAYPPQPYPPAAYPPQPYPPPPQGSSNYPPSGYSSIYPPPY